MSSKKPLVATTEKKIKEEINDMEKKHNMVDKAITCPIAKNKIDTVNEKDKPQASKSLENKSNSSELNKGISLYKSRSLDKSSYFQINETDYTVENKK